MNIELMKEQIKLNEMVNQSFDTVQVASDVIVPDTNPDVRRILQIDGKAFITGAEIQKDRMVLNGRAEFTIIYLAEDAENGMPIKSMRAGADFVHISDMPGAAPGMNMQTTCDVEGIDVNLINSRKVGITAQVNVGCQVYRQVETELVTGVEGENEMETRSRDLKAYSLAADEKVKFNAADRLEVPNGKSPIREILKIDAEPVGYEARAVNGKLVVRGVVKLCTLYLCDAPGDSLEFMEHEIPFNEILDVEDIDEGMDCELDYKVSDIYFETGEDADGDMRILGVEVTLEVAVKAIVPVECRVLSDCFCPGYNIMLKKQSCNVDSIAARESIQTSIKERVELPEDAPPISQVYNVIVKPYIENTNVEDGKIVVSGVLDVYILYLTGDPEMPIYSFKKDIEFTHEEASEAAVMGMECESKVAEVSCTYSLPAENEVDLRINVRLDVRLLCSEAAELVTEIEAEEAEPEPQPSIRIFFVQKDTTLWDVAKKYKVPQERIRQANGLENAEVCEGMRLIIPKQ